MTNMAGVPTAIPAFIGYTATASVDGKSCHLIPMQIESMADFETIFGGPAAGFNLAQGMSLFYANGGDACYVVSVGDASKAVTKDDLLAGLHVIRNQYGPTLLVVPDAVLLETRDAYAAVVGAMLQQCNELQDRFAILDVYGGALATGETLDAILDDFRESVGTIGLSFGAAYFPFLVPFEGGVLPPSAAMAGVFTTNDRTKGVGTAPVNVSLTGVDGVTYAVNPIDDEEALTLPLDGKAVNAIRAFPNRGLVVWGGRTLDGNSADYRYIQVRRTLIYIEQSIKQALEQFVFAPNDGNTWASVTLMITSFLTGVWQSGALIGASAAEAFVVQCGLGMTMTAQDLLDGNLRVQVTLQISAPAEFIALTFVQKMGV